VSSAGAAAGSIYGGLAWKIVPPCVDFAGAVIVLCTVRFFMALALVVCVLLVASLITFIDQGRLVQDGSPDRLRTTEGVFRGLWQIQTLSREG